MLREIDAAQKEDGIFRRWFGDEYFELIVWYNRNDYSIRGFQLCYDIARNERSLTWTAGRGFAHTGVDDGSRPMRHPSSPMLVEDGIFPGQSVLDRFIRSCAGIERVISRLVISKINEYGNLNLDLEEIYAGLENKVNVQKTRRKSDPDRDRLPPEPPDHVTEPALKTFSGFVKNLKHAMTSRRSGAGKGEAASRINEEYKIETSKEDLDDLMKKSQQLAKKISRKKR